MAAPDRFSPHDLEYAPMQELGRLFSEVAQALPEQGLHNEFVDPALDDYDLVITGRRLRQGLPYAAAVLEVGKQVLVEFHPGVPGSDEQDLQPSCNFVIDKPADSIYRQEWIQIQQAPADPTEPWYTLRQATLRPQFQLPGEVSDEAMVAGVELSEDLGLHQLTRAETAALRAIVRHLEGLTTRNVFRRLGGYGLGRLLKP